MSRKILTLAVVVFLWLSLVSFQYARGYYLPGKSAGAGALGGAATGAALGAIIGAATGSPATGAWIGAAAGGLVGGVGGYLYAEHKNNEVRDQQAAAAAYNYQPSQGNYVVNIDQAYVDPAVASPGQQVNLGMQYTMLTPGDAPMSLTLVREVRYQGQLVGQPYQTSVTSPN
ncbi:MAG: YMGG-like glycine zipper-containing protein, partial [Desulfobaccales bacterium]